MLKLSSVLGVGILTILAVWGFMVVAAPGPPPVDNTASTPARQESKLRDVTTVPHTTAVVPTTAAPAVRVAPVTRAIPMAPAPAPVPAAPVATVPALAAAPVPTPPGADEGPPQPTGTQVAADTTDDPVEADDPVDGADPVAAPAPDQPPTVSKRTRRSANCTRYRTYNAATQTYRGFDGVTHPCRP